MGKSFSKSLSTIRGIARLLSIVCVVSTVAVFNGLDSTQPAMRFGHVICKLDMPRFSTMYVSLFCLPAKPIIATLGSAWLGNKNGCLCVYV